MKHQADNETRRVCGSIDTLAMTYLDGELGGEDLRELEVHLVDCATCRARVDTEAATLGTLRKALTAPAAPELLRARVARSLDGEDRLARRKLGSRLLPGAAALAAVAALALFVVANRAPSSEAPVEQLVIDDVRRPRPLEVQGAATDVWVQQHFDPRVEVPAFTDVRVQRWGARLIEVRDREALQLFYRVTTPNGRASDVAVVVFNARGWRLTGHRRQVLDGRTLLVGSYDGASVVSLRSSDDKAYVFTSLHLGADELAALVVRSSLLTHVDQRRP